MSKTKNLCSDMFGGGGRSTDKNVMNTWFHTLKGRKYYGENGPEEGD
jgi:hypothetical protein